MLNQIFYALICGCIASWHLGNYSSKLNTFVGVQCKTLLEQSLDCHIEYQSCECSLFESTIIFRHVIVSSKNHEDWQWNCKKYIVTFSWFNLFFGTLDLHATVDQLAIKTAYAQNRLALESHLEKFTVNSSMPIDIQLRSLCVLNGSIFIHHPNKTPAAQCTWRAHIYWKQHQMHGSFTLLETTLYTPSHPIRSNMCNITGTVHPTAQGPCYKMRINGDINYSPLHEKLCFITGTWDTDHGRLQIYSTDGLFRIDPIMIAKHSDQYSISLSAHAPITTIPIVQRYISSHITNGHAQAKINATITSCAIEKLHVQFTLDDIINTINNTPSNGLLTITKDHSAWNLYTSVHLADIGSLQIKGIYHQDTHIGSLRLLNSTTLTIPKTHYSIVENSLQLNLQKTLLDLQGSLSCLTTDTSIKKKIPITGKLRSNTQTSAATIHCNGYSLSGALAHLPLGITGYIACKDHQTRIASCKGTYQSQSFSPVHLSANVSIAHALSFAQSVFGYTPTTAEGQLLFNASTHKDTWFANFKTDKATVRLGSTYNFIDNCSTKLCGNLHDYMVTVSSFNCHLHKGSISSHCGHITLDKSFRPTDVFIPLTFDHCLLNDKDDLFLITSGSLIYERHHNLAHLTGSLLIDKGHIRNTYITPSNQHRPIILPWLQNPLLHVTIDFLDPLQIMTEFIHANAKGSLKVQGTINNPILQGTVKFLSGSLIFPYTPLYITTGELNFSHSQELTPTIQLVAQNNIQRHRVIVRATGLLGEHKVSLESSPLLREEQIAALLTVGSYDASLNNLAPALLAHNIQKLLFKNRTSAHTLLRRYLGPRFAPVTIKLVPSFMEQSGRGGLRGAIEIDVDNRLHARIQKNFSLSEDTKYELEYAATDNTTMRLIRDERRDLACELEMRWKF